MKAESFSSMVVNMFIKIRDSKYIPTFYDKINEDLRGGWELETSIQL